MAVIGKNILENLTTGMYSDSKVIYREYIQNACDQIDKAIDLRILTKDEGVIEIEIDSKKRNISIRDNATGVKSVDFEETLGDIANSKKVRGENKGFRGIGRLCGLAYCKRLTFRTSYSGENIESQMIIDAKKMRDMLDSPIQYTVDDVLDEITKFAYASAEETEHYFYVELEEINHENYDLLNDKAVSEYLSFVAPVPYSNKFLFSSQIYEHSESLGYKIDEYNILIQGKQVFKGYGTRLYKESSGKKQSYDELTGIQIKDFYNSSQELVAWAWYGLCRFEGVIPKRTNPMYGFRVRQGNIQIGSNESIAHLFKEERGNSYFVGEIFAAHRQLIPNSQRDYFNENSMRVEFESVVKEYCHRTLYDVYYDASKYRKNVNKINSYIQVVEEYDKKRTEGFIDDDEKKSYDSKLVLATDEKEKAVKVLEKYETEELDLEDPKTKVRSNIKREFEQSKLEERAKAAERMQKSIKKESDSGSNYYTDSLSSLSKKDRKLIAKVLGIISRFVTADILVEIKNEIGKEFK